MTNIEIIKNLLLVNLDRQELQDNQILLSEGGQFFPNSFLKALVAEIEELEERCGEKEPQAKSFTVSSDKKSIFNFQKDEFGLRFVQK